MDDEDYLDHNETSESNWFVTTITSAIITGVVVSIVFSIIGGGKYEDRSAQEWFDAYNEEFVKNEELQSQVEAYKEALSEANDRIKEAKNYAGNTYLELKDVLNSLEEVPVR